MHRQPSSHSHTAKRHEKKFPPSLTRIVLLVVCGSVIACQRTPEVQQFSAHGVVAAVKKDASAVRITHEDIPGFMQAMTMEFQVKDPALLTAIQPEDEIDFTVEKTSDSLFITAIKRVDDENAEEAFQDEANEESEKTRVVQQETQTEFTPYPAADFTLTDQDGQSFTLSSLRGKVVLLDFIFTHCPGPCPLLSLKFSQLQKQLGDRFGTDVILLSVTIDPRHDTPEVLRDYAKRYEANLSGWKFLTGATKDIVMTATAYHAEYKADSQGIVDHRLITSVIDRDGVIVKEFTGTNHTVEELFAEVNQLLS